VRARGLFVRLMAAHLLVAVTALGVLGVTLDRLFEHRALNDLERRLVAEARTTQTAIAARSSTELETFVRALGTASGARITIIRTDGVVLADSEHDPATMTNHATPSRPEVLAAIAGRTGSVQRESETIGRPFLYVAIPAKDGVVVRAALPSITVASERAAVRRTLLYSFLAILAFTLGISALIARSVARPLRRMSEEVTRVSQGDFARVDPAGPKEARALAIAVNEMAASLAARVDDLRRETALRDQTLSAMEEAVVLIEGSSIVYANTAARDLLGTEVGGPLPPKLPRPIDGNPTAVEFTTYHPAYREIRAGAAPLPDGRVLVVAQDVTETRRTDRMRRDFVANASHEMKTPVAGILAAAETLQHAITDDPDAAARFAANLAKEARRLSNLISDLLDLARLDQASPEMELSQLSSLVKESIAEAAPLATDKRLTIETSIDANVIMQGRPQDLALMTRNLLDNAMRYTGEGGRITVGLHSDNGTTVLTVSDSGIGIPAKDLPRIFERFYRVDRARARDTGGTGLGLSIVRHIAESHGGTVSAESELGTGSTFTVSLPVTPPAR
jgi:two-component system phosphate regulon sensor histidine kinase PhoR